ncbi:3-hydroxyacyl CoA dehydrogenase [Phaffia rhodozyma]|uniref:3-hydroxyacyl CoA dehydrogenase n=1 Tax=Phaffia rhodozyma TaxID=264483 RepID=A0A0F7SLC5_PHARH|nr:3-hydroxyacyl CoA dehydrogenase [Phaffia rhodozyma]
MSELLLIVYLHGFKGDDTTFKRFPERINHILTETQKDVKVESVVFPQWETRGVLAVAVERFSDWLATITVEKENAFGGAGKASIILCGHSMGGILAADALRNIASSRQNVKDFLWPRVIGLIAFDTPYLGLHPNVFKYTFTKAASNVQAAKDIASTIGLIAPSLFASASSIFPWSSSPTTGTNASNPIGSTSTSSATHGPIPTTTATTTSSSKEQTGSRPTTRSTVSQPAPHIDETPTTTTTAATSKGWASRFTKGVPLVYGLGAAAVAAGAAGAYYKRDDLGLGMGWAQDHLQFVGNLWDGETMRLRLESLDELVHEDGILFRNFYTQLASDPQFILPRTFCILPQPKGPTKPYWVSAKNNIVKGEIDAHTEMFSPSGNDNYYDLGLRAAESIALALTQSRRKMAAAMNQPDPVTAGFSESKTHSTTFTPNMAGMSFDNPIDVDEDKIGDEKL